jgi:hypothetical protein
MTYTDRVSDGLHGDISVAHSLAAFVREELNETDRGRQASEALDDLVALVVTWREVADDWRRGYLAISGRGGSDVRG